MATMITKQSRNSLVSMPLLVTAISADPGLTARQRRALIEIYTAMTEATASRRYGRSS